MLRDRPNENVLATWLVVSVLSLHGKPKGNILEAPSFKSRPEVRLPVSPLEILDEDMLSNHEGGPDGLEQENMCYDLSWSSTYVSPNAFG